MPRTGFFSLPKLGRKNKTVSEESTGNSTPKASMSKSPAPSPPAKTGLRGRLSLEKPQEPPPPPPPVVVRTEKPRRGSVDEQHAVACPPAMKRPVWAITDYKFQECVHKGAASNVFKATCKVSGMSVAVKVYKKAALHPLNHFQIRREMKIHSRLQHPNIIDLYGCFEDEDFFVLVQEQATGGDLFDELRRRRRNLTELETLEIVLLPLLHALSYIHQRGIIHRDLKPENLLLTKNMILKICDFGLAIDCNVERPVTRLGTPQYMPPEIVVNPYKTYPEQHKDNPDCYYDEKVDVWAMAIMVYEVLYGFPTFGKNKDTLTGNILKKEPNFSPDLRSISAEAQEFLAINLSKKPSDRMSVREMFSHPWCRLHNRRSIGMQRTPAALQLGTSPAAAPQPTRRSLCGVESDQGEATPMDVDNAFTMTGFTGAPAAAAAAASSMPSKDARRGVRHSLDSRASGAAYVQRSGADVNPQVTKRVHVDRLGVAPARVAPAAGTISPAAPFTMSAQQQQGASRSSPGMGQQQSLLGAGQVTAVSMFTPRRADALPAVAGASGGVHFPHITPSREGNGRVRRKSMEEESRAARGSPRALLFGEQAVNGNGSGAKPSRHSVDSPAELRQGVAPA